jgi:hypothetical protein
MDPTTMVALGSSALNFFGGMNDASKRAKAELQNTRERIAFQDRQRAIQRGLLGDELGRQQVYARGAGDAFGNSLGQFSGFEGRIGDASSQIADIYKQFLAQKTAQQLQAESILPPTSGPTANREAAMREQATADSMRDADNQANVEGFGRAMGDASRVMAGNESLASLFGNLAQGSARVADQRIRAEEGQFMGQPAYGSGTADLGDLIMGAAKLGMGAYKKFGNQPAATPFGGVQLPSAPNLPSMGGGQGLQANAGGFGVRLPRGLGI